MKNYTLAVFSTLALFSAAQLEVAASPYHADNIVLKSFQATHAPGGVKVTWEFTSQEFEVTCTLEKSTDGVNFTSFRSFYLASTRQQASYLVVDKEAMGQTFYRLRITKQSYNPFTSPIITVNMQYQGAYSTDRPAIAGLSNEGFFGELSTQDKVMCIRLVNINGQAKIKQYVKGKDLERVFRPSLGALPAGYYVLNIKDAQNQPLMNRCIYKF